MAEKNSDRTWTVMNSLLLVVIGYLLLRPGGPVRTQVDGWLQARHEAQLVRRLWPTIQSGATRYSGPQAKTPDVVVFTDYQCPFCKELDASLRKVVSQRPDLVVAYRNFPLPIHALALSAAKASSCAEAQGRFVAMHDHLFESEDWQNTPDWGVEALHAGISDTMVFTHCMADSMTSATIARDIALGDSLAITGTPAVFTSTKKVQSALSEAEIQALLR